VNIYNPYGNMTKKEAFEKMFDFSISKKEFTVEMLSFSDDKIKFKLWGLDEGFAGTETLTIKSSKRNNKDLPGLVIAQDSLNYLGDESLKMKVPKGLFECNLVDSMKTKVIEVGLN